MSAYQEIMEIECKEEKIDDYVFVVMQKYWFVFNYFLFLSDIIVKYAF